MIEESRELRQVSRQQVYEQPVAGVPIDSEYVIFVVDTSGSMQSQNWRYAEQKLGEVLNIYPKLKGIQVMDDEGGYMFTEYRGKWIPDSPARRKAILDRFRGWQAFSNSSPSEGIIAAVRTFWTRDHSISLYMIGDEFTGPSIQEVVDTVDRINRTAGSGERRVRIHALGFPIPGQYPQHTSMRYATLMRILCARNGGVFVGLPEGQAGRETEQLMTMTTLRAALAASCLAPARGLHHDQPRDQGAAAAAAARAASGAGRHPLLGGVQQVHPQGDARLDRLRGQPRARARDQPRLAAEGDVPRARARRRPDAASATSRRRSRSCSSRSSRSTRS